MNRRALVPFLVLACTTFGLGCPGGPQNTGNDGGHTTDAGTDGGTPDSGTPDAGPSPTTATATIGFNGGSLTLDGATLTFPIGALAQDTQITLTHTIDTPPTGFDQGAVIWSVAPKGLPLARPAALSLPFSGAANTAAGFWSTPDGTSFERVGVDVANGMATLRPVRLGDGFVGFPSGHDTLTIYVADTTFRYAPSSGATAEPANLLTGQVEVLVPNSSQGYTTYSGTGDTLGIGRITGVPPSPTYYVGVTPSGGIPLFVATPHGTVDLAALLDGRDWTTGSSQGTQVTFDGTGLSGWVANDAILAQTLAFVGTAPVGDLTFATAPSTGDTSFTGGVLDWQAEPILDDAKGDSILLFHTRGSSLPSGVSYTDILDFATVTNVGLVDGQNVQDQATFAPATQVPLSLTVDAPSFRQAIAAFQPPQGSQTVSTGLGLSLYYTRAPSTLGVGTGGVDLVSGSVPVDGTSPIAVSLTYGDPWPGQGTHQLWLTVSTYYADANNHYEGAFASATMAASDATASTTPTPAVGVPESIEVGGQPLTDPVTGVGTTPTISWQPPSVGTPDTYAVFVVNTQLKRVFTVRTASTSFVMPSGILQAGTSYQLWVSALSNPNNDYILNDGPPGGSLTDSGATVLTTTFTP